MPYLLVLRGVIGAGKTEIARAILGRCKGFKLVELDDIKREKHGCSLQCDPNEDFTEAGRRARAYLDEGFHTIVEEAFVERGHLCMVLTEVDRKIESQDVIFIWLGCSMSTSLARKGNSIPAQAIELQHQRYAFRYRAPREHIIMTDDRSVDDVAVEIISTLEL